jgi:hypothetical protein
MVIDKVAPVSPPPAQAPPITPAVAATQPAVTSPALGIAKPVNPAPPGPPNVSAPIVAPSSTSTVVFPSTLQAASNSNNDAAPPAPPVVDPTRKAAPDSICTNIPSSSSKDSGITLPAINPRVQQLEEEVQELRRKLERAEARLAQRDGGAGSMSREVALEKELDDVHAKLLSARQDKQVLENSVRDIQSRLSALENTQFSSDGGKTFALFNMNSGLIDSGGGEDMLDAMLRKGEREKELESMLLKSKRDKDKAIRIIVQIIGKDRIGSFLNRHAGSPDILDKLLEYFANNVQLGGSNSGESNLGDFEAAGRNKTLQRSVSASDIAQKLGRTSKANQRSPSPDKTQRGKIGGKSPAAYRSRMDEYFRSTISGRDY